MVGSSAYQIGGYLNRIEKARAKESRAIVRSYKAGEVSKGAALALLRANGCRVGDALDMLNRAEKIIAKKGLTPTN